MDGEKEIRCTSEIITFTFLSLSQWDSTFEGLKNLLYSFYFKKWEKVLSSKSYLKQKASVDYLCQEKKKKTKRGKNTE